MFFLLLGLTVSLWVAGLGLAYLDWRDDANDRIGRALGLGSPELTQGDAPSMLLETQSDLSSVLSGMAQKIRFFRGIDLMLYRAGRPMSLARLVTSTAFLTLVGALLGKALAFPPLFLVGLLPILVVWQKKKNRMSKFQEDLPQALALFSRALRAGHGLTAGFQMVAESLSDPVSTEFGMVAREISLGLDSGTAVANLQDRLDVPDLAIFSTAVLVQIETGGNLAEILDNLGGVIRERMAFGGKVKALTGQSRMSANILSALPLGLATLLSVLDPEYSTVFLEDPTGQILGIAMLVSVSLGFFLCRHLAHVEA